MSIEIGNPAPDFILYDSAKNKIHLADFRGTNVVLLFFPLAFTSVCTKELCGVSDSLDSFNDLHAQVLGISVDSLYTLGRYKELYKISFPLLSDFNKEVSANYQTLYEHFSYGMKGVSKRSVYVIDKNGILQYFEILENAGDLPDLDAVKEKLAHLERIG